MPVIYTMAAEENYPASLTSDLPNFCFCDKQYIGTSYDRVRRNIMYSAVVTDQALDSQGYVLQTNTTGKTLWSGLGATPNGNKLNLNVEFVFQTAVKNIDNKAVTFHTSYDPAQVVPAGIGAGGITAYTTSVVTSGAAATVEGVVFTGGSGYGAVGEIQRPGGQWVVVLWDIGANYQIGDVLSYNIDGPTHSITITGINTGSDGTWTRKVWDSRLFGHDVQAIVNPRNGDFWVHMESCELHLFPRSADYAMVISPLELPYTLAQNQVADGAPIGITTDWVYFWASGFGDKMMIVPSSITPAETAADCLLATYTYDFPGTNTYYFRQAVGSDANLWVFATKMTGTRDYRLWKCVPGVGFTDMTPWAAGTGPNTNCADWTADTLDRPYSARHYIVQLPQTDCLALISKNLPGDWTAGPAYEPEHLRLDCTYYDINAAAFDYHEQMVFGYMSATWTVATLETAAWAVVNVLEFDNDLECSDYVHDVDYTLRRMHFLCKPVADGAIVPGFTGYLSVFVDYKFVYGVAPEVIQVIAETGWDERYSAYASRLGQPGIVSGSLPAVSFGVLNTADYTAFNAADNGIWDRVSGDMWLSGDAPGFCKFNLGFSSRYDAASNGVSSFAILTAPVASSPFLRLSISDPVTLDEVISPKDLLVPDCESSSRTIPIAPGHWTLDTPTNLVEGLWHLEGETVSILADGQVMEPQVVTNGRVTLPLNVTRAHVGLQYVICATTLPISTPQAVVEDRRKIVNGIAVRVDKTGGVKVGRDTSNMYDMRRNIGNVAPEMLTGITHTLISTNWEDNGQVHFRQTEPLPITLLSIMLDVEVGDDQN